MKSPITTALALPHAVEDDAFLHAIDRWKKRLLAIFSLLALVIAIIVALSIEVGGALKVWHLEFGNSTHAATTHPKQDRECACLQAGASP